MTNSEVLQKVLPIYMKRVNMNQTDLANALEVSKSTVHCWLHGKAFPRMKEIEKMSKIFGCDTDDLLSTKDLDFVSIRKPFSQSVIKLIEDKIKRSDEDTELRSLWSNATPAARKAALAVLRSMKEGD